MILNYSEKEKRPPKCGTLSVIVRWLGVASIEKKGKKTKEQKTSKDNQNGGIKILWCHPALSSCVLLSRFWTRTKKSV